MIIKRNQRNKYFKECLSEDNFSSEKRTDLTYNQNQSTPTPYNPVGDEYNLDDFKDINNDIEQFNDHQADTSIDDLLSQYEDINDIGETIINHPESSEYSNYNEPNIVMPHIKERTERRRGDRRRGYRRVDDRVLISRAQEEANAIKENAAQEGFEYGLNSAKDELQNLNVAISDFLRAKELALETVSSEIAFLAVKVAEKIIKTEVSCDETIILNIVSEVLKGIGKDESKIIIKTNPADKILVQENISKIYPYANTGSNVIVIEDNAVEWGSCIVETNNGMIDASFSTQLQILLKAFETEL